MEVTTLESEMDQGHDRFRELLEIRYHRLVNEPHRYFTPTGKFEEFINQAMSGKYMVNLFEAANGVGKTYGMSMLLANLFWPVNNKWCRAPLFKLWPFLKRGRIVSYPNTVTETLIPTLKACFPVGRYGLSRYQTTKEGKRYASHWVTDTGFEFTIMTYDQEPREFESANLGWFWEDEPATRPIHTANYSRLRMGGVGFLTETPLKGSQWLYDDIVDKPYDQLEKEHKSVITADLESACQEHGMRGFMAHDRIEELVAGYPEEELQARVFGKHHHLSGLVFKKWTPEIHVIDPFTINPEDYVVVHSLDPHPRTPDAGIWVAIDRYGRHIVCDELFEAIETTELAAKVKARNNGLRIVKQLIDPAAFIIDKHTGYQLANDLDRNYQLTYEPGSKERTLAVSKIREALDFKMVNGEMLVPPKLYVFRTCPHTAWEISRWQWQDWRGLSAQFKNPKEKPMDKDDHMVEALGRVLVADIHFEEMSAPTDFTVRDTIARKNNTNLDPYK
jgi:hypothetical protein